MHNILDILVKCFPVPQTHITLVTQMVGLYQDPEGKTIFSSIDPSQSVANLTREEDTIESLRQQVQELRNEVSVIARVHKNGQLE